MLAFSLTPCAHADELAEVRRLYVSGQVPTALARVERALAARPNDAQLQFQKGLMLAEGKRVAEAGAVFRKLIEDHPDLAEPYNNLAALQAAAGDYAQARATLEQALRANPAYATAHENLGDVYAALAAESYRKALVLEPGNSSVARKIELMRELHKPQLAPSASGRSAPPLASAGGAVK